MSEQTKASFVKGAAILAAAGLISRFLGLFYRIVLNYTIGLEGAGLYQLAYPLYTFLLVVSVSGIPIALAKMVSEKIAMGRGGDAYRIFQIALRLAVFFGGGFSVFMILAAKPFIMLTHNDPRGVYTMIAIAPAVFVVSIMAAYRGFFQGMQNMKPTAYSQVVEQIIRMITIVGLALVLLPFGLQWAAAGATFSAVTGAIAGLIVMWYFYNQHKTTFAQWRQGSVSDESTGSIIRRMAQYAIPVIISASMVQLMGLVSSSLVAARLQMIGYAVDKATVLYGELTGVALVLVHFPEIITVSLQTSLIPSISSAYTLGLVDTIHERAKLGMRLALLTSTPAAVGLYILAAPLADLFGKNPTPMAAQSLRILAFGVVFIALQQITSGILQGIGKVNVPVYNMVAGVTVNAILTYFLTADPAFGINGAALAIMLGFSTVSILNIIGVKRALRTHLSLGRMFAKPLISSVIMAAFVYLTYNGLFALLKGTGLVGLSKAAAIGVAVCIGIAVYFLSVIYTGGLSREDLQQIPGGRKLIVPFQRLGVLKK